ncbi:MAG: hypothetical protein L0H79_04800 [Intrasporangium sp.]|uniref:hypothetical protein n=1 Tax=Intrasporangium sp. TaxID=1925024 RepID=UPI0026480FB2|nr:hypothetical protein [Intrasporangium sp.]MDN5795053.1 hypothetical protein [Intrasporangium sp.]
MTTSADGHDGDRPAVGTVAEEAARLVDLLSGLGVGGSATRTPSKPSGQPDEGSADASPTCTCGGQRPAACGLCPVCQLIAFVQRVSPETIDRLAEVVELAATGLRDLAVVQRSRRDREQPAEADSSDGDERGHPAEGGV